MASPASPSTATGTASSAPSTWPAATSPSPPRCCCTAAPGLEKNLDLAATLRDRGWNALLFHYRGCWGSAGRYDLRTIPRDVPRRSATCAGCPRVDPARIAVVGHSLGGWAAIVTAAAEPQAAVGRGLRSGGAARRPRSR